MLAEYDELPPMFKATLSGSELVVLEVNAHIYMRNGTEGLSKTKLGAVEALKRKTMERFLDEMNTIDWKGRQFVRDYSQSG